MSSNMDEREFARSEKVVTRLLENIVELVQLSDVSERSKELSAQVN